MKNIEIINAINGANKFVESENASKIAKLSVKGEFALNKNVKALMESYKPYETSYKKIKESDLSDEEKNEQLKELLDCENEVTIEKVHESDFKDGTTFQDISLLEFMVEI